MKLKLFSVLALGGLLSAAFACGDSSGDGGSGGSGGSGGDTTSTTKSSTSSTKASTGTGNTTTTGQTTTTGSAMCDDGTMAAIDSQTCLTCIQCTQTGNCNAEWVAYANDPNYQAYVDCSTPCMDQACQDACDAMYQTTADLFIDALSCSVCVECPNNCDAANSCG